MKVYLAAQYGWRDTLKQYAKQLDAVGIEVTSSWLRERKDPKSELHDLSMAFLREHAKIDIDDMEASDIIVLFTVSSVTASKRGGRHFESGYAYKAGKLLIICGPIENIFHTLPNVKQFDTFDLVLQYLKELKDEAKE